MPLQILGPQFPEEKTVFRNAAGVSKTLSVVVHKTYEGSTDWLPEKWHERLKMALAHDTVNIEGDKYLGGISQDGDYEIQWQEFLDYPTAPAKFKVQVTPFAATNSNCMSCEEATQLNLEDDTFEDVYGEPIPLQESTEYQLNVAANDEICCSPAVFSITYYDPYFIASASIDQDGILTIVINTPVTITNGVHLVTYRVTCPNGSYDEARVYGNVDGSIEECLAPLNVTLAANTAFSASPQWDDPSPLPDSYEWQLFEMQAPGVPVQTGTSPTGGVFPTLSGLDDGTDYGFYVRSVCGAGFSNWIELLFTTPVNSASCGQYRVHFNDGTGISTNSADITYLDCNSDYQTQTVFNMRSRVICALQTTPGNPVDIVNATDIDYEGLC